MVAVSPSLFSSFYEMIRTLFVLSSYVHISHRDIRGYPSLLLVACGKAGLVARVISRVNRGGVAVLY